MQPPQVLIACYADADLLAGALASVPDDWPVHVVDGRLASFEAINGRDVTPQAKAICETCPTATYHRPPDDALPFGHGHDAPPDARAPQFEHSRYQFACLDADRWTLAFDTDERLARFDADLDGLDPRRQYLVSVHMDDHAVADVTGDRAYIPRLYVPRYWTPWTGDVLLPRDEVSRSASLATVRAAADRKRHFARQSMKIMHDIHIDNVGDDRPPDYRTARIDQLDGMYPEV